MPDVKILIVEDEIAIQEMLMLALENAGLEVTTAASAEHAMQILTVDHIDLIVLDWMLPGISGLELGKRLKHAPCYKKLPIILLTARCEEEDKVRGLEMGADDYITKPFSPKELIARIKAVLRRSGKFSESCALNVNDLIMDPEQSQLSIAGHMLDISPTEFRLMQFFMTNPGKVYSRNQLLDQVWGRSAFIDARTVDVHIRRLRKTLDKHDRRELIQTVRGFGYRLQPDF